MALNSLLLNNPVLAKSSAPLITPAQQAQVNAQNAIHAQAAAPANPAPHGASTGGNVLGASTVSTSSVSPQSAAQSAAAAANSQYQNYVNQSYDTQIGGLQGILGTLQPAQDAANLQLNNQYQNQHNALDTSKAQGERNLQFATDQINDQKAKSLKDIADQVFNGSMSYNNQLGAYGAGNSSAAGLIQRALAGLAAKNRSGVMDSAGTQLKQVDMQHQDLNTDYTNNVRSLDDWKNGAFNDMVNQYAQQRLQLQQQIAGAQGQKAAYLADMGRKLDASVLDGLSNLQNAYKGYAQQLNSQYANPTAPNLSIRPELQQFAVNPISAGQLDQINTQPLQATAQTDGAQYLMKRPDQELGLM